MSQAPPNVVTSLEIAPFAIVTEVYPASWIFNRQNLLNISTSAVRSQPARRKRYFRMCACIWAVCICVCVIMII